MFPKWRIIPLVLPSACYALQYTGQLLLQACISQVRIYYPVTILNSLRKLLRHSVHLACENTIEYDPELMVPYNHGVNPNTTHLVKCLQLDMMSYHFGVVEALEVSNDQASLESRNADAVNFQIELPREPKPTIAPIQEQGLQGSIAVTDTRPLKQFICWLALF